MDKKDRQQELIFGLHPIVELLKAKRRKIARLYTTKPTPKCWDDVARILPPSVPIQYVPRDVLTRLAQSPDHQGLLAYVTPFPLRSKPFEAARHPFVLLIDGIQDPRNLGAILRSAYCIGVNGIIVLKKSSSPLTAIALKASAGLAEYLEIYQASTAMSAVQELKKNGYHIYLASLDGEDATKVQYQRPLCLVIGSEGRGISQEIARTGKTITIPQRQPDISYNASVAAGILLFLIAHQPVKIS